MIDLRGWAGALVVLVSVTACQSSVAPSPSADTIELTVTLPIRTTDKAVVAAAIDVMSERLRTLGVGEFSSSTGSSQMFMIPVDGTTDRTPIDAVLRTPGVVRIIGWTDDDPPQAGDPAPTTGTPIVDGARPITSAKLDTSAESPTIELGLGPEATAALASFTTDHVGGYVVIALDGTVLDSAVVMSTIPDGRMALSFASPGPIPPEAIAAIMDSGPLPAGWVAP